MKTTGGKRPCTSRGSSKAKGRKRVGEEKASLVQGRQRGTKAVKKQLEEGDGQAAKLQRKSAQSARTNAKEVGAS